MRKASLCCAALLLTACMGAVPSHVRQYREGPTALRKGEAVSAVLLRYGNPKVDAEDYAETLDDKAEYFGNCVSEGLRKRGVAVVPATVLPPALAAPLPAGEGRPLPEAMLSRIEAGGGSWEGPRFLVALEAETKESDPRSIAYMEAGGEAFGLIVGETRVRSTALQAYVFDPAAPRYLGRVESTSWGYVGWEMPILYCILPCPPVPHTARTEIQACKDLGADLAEFLNRGRSPRESPSPGEGR